MDKQQVLDLINYGLFFSDLDKILTELSNLIFRMEPVGVPTNFVSVHYKGNDYTSIYPKSYVPAVQITDIKVDPSLVGQLDKLIQEKQEMEQDMAIVSSYVRKALNISTNSIDLHMLLDESLHKYLGTYYGFGIATISDGQIAVFKAKNTHLFETIKKKQLTNLLLKRN